MLAAPAPPPTPGTSLFTIIAAVAGAVVAVVTVVALWHKVTAGRRARGAAKTPEVRRVLFELRRLVEELSAAGGQRTRFFMQEPTQRTGQGLQDLADALNDAELARCCRAAHESWTRLFQLAPHSRPFVLYEGRPETPEDRDDRRRLGEQAAEAHRTLELIEQALARVNELEKRLRPT